MNLTRQQLEAEMNKVLDMANTTHRDMIMANANTIRKMEQLEMSSGAIMLSLCLGTMMCMRKMEKQPEFTPYVVGAKMILDEMKDEMVEKPLET